MPQRCMAQLVAPGIRCQTHLGIPIAQQEQTGVALTTIGASSLGATSTANVTRRWHPLSTAVLMWPTTATTPA